MRKFVFPFSERFPSFEPGWVWLCGAGPGDPGLMTLHAASALQQADHIVYDALVDEDILQLAPDHAVMEYAGKRGGRPSPKQRDISLRLIELARDRKKVLRLKGGDPFVFGRGGEEAMTLTDAGVPFRIIPGISAGIGGLAYAGIPVTHRDVNQTVLFLTGHDQTGTMPGAIDWNAVANAAPVIVMYMAMKHLGSICEKLMSGGRASDEPAAIVTNATLADMQVLETTLGRAAAEADARSMKPPALFVLGDVVPLRKSLDWLGAMNGMPLVPRDLPLQSDAG